MNWNFFGIRQKGKSGIQRRHSFHPITTQDSILFRLFSPRWPKAKEWRGACLLIQDGL